MVSSHRDQSEDVSESELSVAAPSEFHALKQFIPDSNGRPALSSLQDSPVVVENPAYVRKAAPPLPRVPPLTASVGDFVFQEMLESYQDSTPREVPHGPFCSVLGASSPLVCAYRKSTKNSAPPSIAPSRSLTATPPNQPSSIRAVPQCDASPPQALRCSSASRMLPSRSRR